MQNLQPTIRWVNHASFVLQHGDVRLISDPWLFGSAFNNGWDLLCETKFTIDDFEQQGITHLWFSHEHPDHFAPPVLKQIPAHVRQNITVLFQTTEDQKVLRYCRVLGFQTVELPVHGWYELTPDLRVMCGKIPFFDSWLLIEAGETKILNANDCVVDGEGIASEIARYTGAVDVLLTQFSYANWEGNPDELELRVASAAEKLRRVKLQVETFTPTYVIPFASFVYFSHEENFFCNDAINTIRDAHTFIHTQTDVIPVVLYPDDCWTVGASHDNETSLRAYDADYDLSQKLLRQTDSVTLDTLVTLSHDYIQRMSAQNSRFFIKLLSLPPLRYFEPLRLALTDLKKVVLFDMTQGLQVVHDIDEYSLDEYSLDEYSPDDADIFLSSESLAYIFQFDWGFDTLTVNGRFQASQTQYKRMIKTLFLGSLNNTGRYLHPKTLFDIEFVKRALRKLRKLT
ncbi:MAG: MBL fold metallo-hydrolase [Chloroflexota bacterium]